MKEMTTAELRKQAIEAENDLQWGRAIDLWQAAMDNYPGRFDQPQSALIRLDIKNMERRQKACAAMYFPA